MGISRELVGQWRNGKRMPTEERRDALCVILKCHPEDLFQAVTEQPAMLPLTEWAKREHIPLQRARDLFTLRILTGECRTAFGVLVPIDLNAPSDSKTLVLVAKRRPRWVPVFQQNFPQLFETAQIHRGDLADEVGVCPGAVAHWIKGRNYPRRERIPGIAKALGVSITDLIGEMRP
jgi:transcriptional regulator with XRE-family HTH domain